MGVSYWAAKIGDETRSVSVAEVLETLPDMQREAVRLKLLEGRRLEDIATILGRSLPATAGLLKRGMAKLRENMSEESWL